MSEQTSTGLQVNGNVSSQESDDEKVLSTVESILKIEERSELRDRIAELVRENVSLKRRVECLELEAEKDFCIDTLPQTEEGDESSSINYHVVEDEANVLCNVKEEEESTEDKSLRPMKNTCWNCGGEHMIADCPEPRNSKEIAKNRREFQRNQPPSGARYHIDEPQRFARLSPGLPSERLRNALGIKDDQLPSYVYRMRELGYPPGWLKEAEINHSGMALYVEQNKALPDNGDEEGEIADQQDKVQYDISKIHEWPGFNVPVGNGFRDETKHYRVPAINPEHAKEKMVKKMQPKEQKGYVRGVMQDTSTGNEQDKPEAATKEAEVDEDEEMPEVRQQTPAKADVVTSVDPGTPICKLYSPYVKLPPQEKWITDTTDHIMFENLPETTGKYERMVGLLKKCRSTKKAIAKAALDCNPDEAASQS